MSTFITCLHNCHNATAPSFRPVQMEGIWILHIHGKHFDANIKTHRKSWDNHCHTHTGCSCDLVHGYRPTTPLEYLRWGCHLYRAYTSQDTRKFIKVQYSAGWAEHFGEETTLFGPNEEPLMLDLINIPVDVAWVNKVPSHPRGMDNAMRPNFPTPSHPDAQLSQHLLTHNFPLSTTGTFTSIQGGFYDCHNIFATCPRKVQVIFVISPIWSTSTTDYPSSLWCKETIEADVYLAILPKQEPTTRVISRIRFDESPNGPYLCYINVWMLVYLEMLSEAGHFDVDLWSYKELMAATLNKDSARRSQLENADLIFGGPYWNGDILDEAELHRFSAGEMKTTYDYLNGLSLRGITVWPHPMELSINGMKVAQYKMISHAAASLNTPTPALAVLTRSELIAMVASLGDHRWAAIKRERSSIAKHCYLPEDGDQQQRCNRLREQLQEEDRLWGSGEEALGLPRPQWFAQAYVPQLRHLGEIRFIFVNGALLYWVSTIPKDGDLSMLQLEVGHPILDPEHIRYDHNQHAEQRQDWLTDAKADSSKLTRKFEQWATEMLGKLVIAEEYMGKKASSLRLFARLDCSVLHDHKTRQHQCFVNEVTRCHDTALWLDNATHKSQDISFLARFTEAIYHAAATGALCKPHPPHPIVSN